MMYQNDKTVCTGISFIEILVVLLLMSLFVTFAVPRFMSSQKGRAKKQFFTEFSTLISQTMYQAIISKKVHQIFWNLAQNEIQVKIYDNTSESANKHQGFKPIADNSFNSKIKIPQQFVIRNFFIQKNEDEIKPGEKKDSIWTYIMPDGTSQHAIINIQDEEESEQNKFSLIINPFYSQVSLYESFQKP